MKGSVKNLLDGSGDRSGESRPDEDVEAARAGRVIMDKRIPASRCLDFGPGGFTAKKIPPQITAKHR